MLIVLKLQNKKIPGIKKINRVPGIEILYTKKSGKFYHIKYFVDVGKGMRMIGFSSKDATFKTLHSMDLYDMALKLVARLEIAKDISEEDFLIAISKIVTSTKYKMPKPLKESTVNKLNEGVGDAVQIFKSLPDELKFIVGFFGVIYGILFVIPVLLQLRNVIVKVGNWAHERYVSGPAEQEINQQLFVGQTSDDPAFAVYDNLKQYINFIIEKKANALIVCGPPGMSKTYTVRRTLYFAKKQPGKDYIIEKGATLGLLATYSLLYKNRKRVLVLDDFDTPLTNLDIVNLLKSITDTYSKRIISLPRERVLGTLNKGEKVIGVPEKFEFNGQLIIITNLTKSQIDDALLSRAPAFEVNYNVKEVLDSTAKMLKFINPSVNMKLKEEAYNYILLLYKNDKKINVSFRAVKASIDARVGNPQGWKDMVHIIVQYKGGNIKS